jgi:hypothetical protein
LQNIRFQNRCKEKYVCYIMYSPHKKNVIMQSKEKY